jgi:hypothetical protein
LVSREILIGRGLAHVSESSARPMYRTETSLHTALEGCRTRK